MSISPLRYLAAVLVWAGSLAMAQAQTPPNDAFANATAITGPLPVSLSATNTGASLEPGEPQHHEQETNASVWWKWTAPASGPYRLNTTGSSFDTILAVYTGTSLNALTVIASDDEGGGNYTSSVLINATAGSLYYFAVSGYADSPPGSIFLNLLVVEPPANDNWSAATVLAPNPPVLLNFTNLTQATFEEAEPLPPLFFQSRTIWWQWTPASGQTVILDTRADFATGDITVFTGTALASLTPVTTGLRSGSSYIFSPVPGTVYSIRGAHYDYAPDSATFSLRVFNPPPNDNWAAAATVASTLPASVTGSQVDSTSETGEPANFGPSVWWKWTAPSPGEVQVVAEPIQPDTDNNYYETSVSVFQGAAPLSSLTILTSPTTYSSFGAFRAVAGTEYFIRITHFSSSVPASSVRVSLQAGPPPPDNDAFAAATVLSGLPSALTTGTLASASREPGEPGTSNSIWYQWVATATGKTGLVVQPESDSNVQAQVFTGSSLASLTTVSAVGAPQFDAVAGTTYRIQVTGSLYSPTSGPLSIQLVPVPANDNFAAAAVLASSLPATASGTTAGAGTETGEGSFGSSVWYQWTAPAAGPVTFTLANPLDNPSYPYAILYTGSAVESLIPVVSTDSVVRFTATAGTVYRIKIQSSQTPGAFQINLSLPPANDDFASNTVIPAGATATVTGNLLGSTAEEGEPTSSVQTLWWRWTPAQSGRVTFVASLSDPEIYVRCNVWEGTALTALTGFPKSNTGITFDAVAGRTYRIQAGLGMPLITGSLVTLSVYGVPANDDFANASTLTGPGPLTATGWNFSASSETADPLRGASFSGHAFYPVWWEWTAPSNDLVVIDTLGSSFDSLLHVYEGPAISSLNLVRTSNDAAADLTSRVAFLPSAGVTYYIRVSGYGSKRQGGITLNLRQYPAANTVASHLQRGRAALEGGTAAHIATADDHFAAAAALDPANLEAKVLRAITRLGRLQQQTGFTNLLAQWGFTTKRANLVRPRYLAPRTADRIANPPSAADTAQALAFANDTFLPELAIFEASLATVSSPSFSLPLTDAESQLRFLTLDAADLRILRATGQLLKALIHTANTFNSDLRVKALLDLRDGRDLNAETVVGLATSFLERRPSDDRTAAKAAFKAANSLYQPAYTAMQARNSPAGPTAFLFYIPETETDVYAEHTEDANDAALSFDGPVTWDGTTVNLSALVTTPSSLRSLVPKLKWNKAVASTAPDPTFAGALPGGTQAIADQFLKNQRLLHDVSSYLAWMGNYLGTREPEEQLPTADADGDGFDNYTEYVFSLNPEAFSNVSEFQASGVVPNPANADLPHFTYSFIRLKSPAPVAYTVLVSDNLTTWDDTGTQLEPANAPVAQPDGVSEQVTRRLKQPATLAPKKYLKIRALPVP